MRRLLLLSRALLAVSVVQSHMVRGFATATLAAVVVVLFDESLAPRAATPLLLLQVFVGATGFAIPARRGHYDLILTRGESRLRIGLMHWCLSVLPGLCAWGLLALTEGFRGGSALRGPGAMLGLLLVSTVPWAANVRLPRVSAAIAWTIVSAMESSLAPSEGPVVAGLLRPWELAGSSWTSDEALAMWAVAGLWSAGAMTAALVWIARMDVPLESAQ